jgi:uncharacterized protein involved in type VI secretion and phage assembly
MAVREMRNKVYGVVVGIVTNNKDTAGKYRVKVRFPQWPNGDESGQTSEESDWCRVCTFMAGNGRGMFCLPEVGDEVLVAFENGDVARPYVVASLWNANDAAILDNKGGKNNLRSFKSRSGHELTFCDDKDNGESILIKSNGKAKIFIDDKNKKIEIVDHDGKNTVTIDGKNNKVDVVGEDKISIKAKGDFNLEAKTITMKATGGDFKAQASSNVEIKASSNFTLKGGGTGEVNSSGALTVKGSQVNIN